MLTSLQIKNYALIEKLEVDFSSGFSVITGETGTGKSVLLGAISMLLGERSDSKLVRNISVYYLFLQIKQKFSCHAGLYGLWAEIICTRQLVSRTMFLLIADKEFDNVLSSNPLLSVHSNHRTVTAFPFPHRHDGQRIR